MRLRQFTAATTAGALLELRATLGEEALVLSTHDGPDGVVITAAVEVDDDVAATGLPSHAAAPLHGRPRGDDPALRAGEDELRFDVALIRTQLEQLGRKVHRMDRTLLDLDASLVALGPDAREVAGRLTSSGFRSDLARPVAQSFERALATTRSHAAALQQSLLEHVAIASPGTARIEALVGPTGCGKTTTVAKLAARAVRAGGPAPGLIVADNDRVGAAEQLAGYARLLGAPLRIARDADELAEALDELAGCASILIDTAGLGGDAATCAELHALLAGAGRELSVSAVVSATAALSSLQRAWPQIARLAPQRCIVTKLDECDEPGTACSWLAEAQLPLAWLATGRRVPDDLLPASGEDLVRWLVAA